MGLLPSDPHGMLVIPASDDCMAAYLTAYWDRTIQVVNVHEVLVSHGLTHVGRRVTPLDPQIPPAAQLE